MMYLTLIEKWEVASCNVSVVSCPIVKFNNNPLADYDTIMYLEMHQGNSKN